MQTLRSLVLGSMLALSASCSMVAKPPPPLPAIIWLNHQDITISTWQPIDLSTNGTAVFVDTKPGATFPAATLLPIYVPTIPPGLRITGMRVCYGIVGDHPDTKVNRLRLAQFDVTTGGGTHYPGYVVRLEDTSTGNQAPAPPPGGFAFDDGAGFLCVDSVGTVCLDPANGTISADTGVQLGDPTDDIVIMAVGLHYDASCTP